MELSVLLARLPAQQLPRRRGRWQLRRRQMCGVANWAASLYGGLCCGCRLNGRPLLLSAGEGAALLLSR
jgi:hypothetical protein